MDNQMRFGERKGLPVNVETLANSRSGTEKLVDTFLTYLALVKPWIIVLVLISTLGGVFIAQGTLPDTWLLVNTLLGIGLATAGAAALNNFIDTDIDSKMVRTSKRPTASGAISKDNALICGLVLSFLSIAVMSTGTNAVASSLTLGSIFFYVVIYTYCLKRITPLATFIGGIPGALPPVIGYAAVKPDIDIHALALFLILFAWQHPHFWSLALKYRKEYEKAGVQNLPVARGVDETKKQIAVWAGILAVVSLLPYILGMAGLLYLSFAGFMGITFFSMSIWFLLSQRKVAMSLFFFSIVHLASLFCMMVVDLT